MGNALKESKHSSPDRISQRKHIHVRALGGNDTVTDYSVFKPQQILGNLRVSGSKLLSWLRAMVDLALAHDNYDAVKSYLTEITKIISTDTEQYNSDDIEYLRGLLWNYSIQFEE